jgi:indole-3-glycerol phosphate synthase
VKKILEIIVESKRLEVLNLKENFDLNFFEKSDNYKRKCYSLKEFLLDKTKNSIISEFKRKSPSKGVINDKSSVEEVVKAYQNADVSAVSILTDKDYFGGSEKDLMRARTILNLPILRKDFIIDQFQIHQSKYLGADVILLIAAILTKEQIEDFTNLAHKLSLSVILELHDQSEIEKIYSKVDVIGVNNRNLGTFKVDIQNSVEMMKLLPKDALLISESGISEVNSIKMLQNIGFKGFLIGENFMKTDDPAKAVSEFSNNLTHKISNVN